MIAASSVAILQRET